MHFPLLPLFTKSLLPPLLLLLQPHISFLHFLQSPLSSGLLLLLFPLLVAPRPLLLLLQLLHLLQHLLQHILQHLLQFLQLFLHQYFLPLSLQHLHYMPLFLHFRNNHLNRHLILLLLTNSVFRILIIILIFLLLLPLVLRVLLEE